MTLIAALALLAALHAAATGARQVARGLRAAASLDVVRGIRRLVIAVAAAVFALGLLTGERGFVVFAAVFLAEELYETGVLALVLRRSEAGSA
jgi:hypothetical protein